MKKLSLLLILLTGFVFFTACEDDIDNPVLDMSQAIAPVLQELDQQSFNLEEYEGDFVFEWSPADYGLENLPTINYRLIGYDSSNEDDYVNKMFVLGETTETSFTVSSSRMNQALFQMDIMPFNFEDVSFRVMAFYSLSTDATWLFSSPIELELRGFEIFTFAIVAGSYQDWDYQNEQTIVHSPEANNLFEGYLYFEEPNTEVLFSLGSSGLFVYGDNDGDGELDQDGEPIVIEEPGVYRVTLDFDAETYEFFKTDWALIGSAAEGWNTDVPMDIDLDFWEENWKVRYTITREMVTGHFKFRANGAWDLIDGGINMGLDEDAEEEGVLMYFGFGNDIPIDEDGVYTIIQDLSGPVYRYEVHPE